MAKSWAARLCRLPKQELFVDQELINKVKSKCCGIKEIKIKPRVMLRLSVLHNSLIEAEM